jgi:hypothetical protein
MNTTSMLKIESRKFPIKIQDSVSVSNDDAPSIPQQMEYNISFSSKKPFLFSSFDLFKRNLKLIIFDETSYEISASESHHI